MCHNDIYVNFFEQALVNENNPKRAAAMTKNKAGKNYLILPLIFHGLIISK